MQYRRWRDRGGPQISRSVPYLAVGFYAVLMLMLTIIGSGRGPSLEPGAGSTALRSMVDGVVGGAFVAGAVLTTFAGGRRRAARVPGWITALGPLISFQALAVTGWALSDLPRHSALHLTGLLVLATLGLVCVAGVLLRFRSGRRSVDDHVVVGLGMGLTAAGFLETQIPVADSPPYPVLVLAAVLVATQLSTVAWVLSARVMSATKQTLLVVTLLTAGAELLLTLTSLRGTGWDWTVSVMRNGTAAAWAVLAWSSLRGRIEEDRSRWEDIDRAIVLDRDHRERLHELRSTLAGLVNGSEMLDTAGIPSDVRERLWRSVRSELSRMQRLLAEQDRPVTDIDLDEDLNLILDLQRLKGRRVEVRNSGDSVHARYDALAEVMNILIDNAATHGGSDDSLVEVVRHDDTVDITVTDFGPGIPHEQREEIFGWGHRASDSPGEGIGLSMARRLVTEDGGSLRLIDPPAGGTSFVISLPAARRSSEMYES